MIRLLFKHKKLLLFLLISFLTLNVYSLFFYTFKNESRSNEIFVNTKSNFYNLKNAQIENKNTSLLYDSKVLIFSSSKKLSYQLKELLKVLDSVRFEYKLIKLSQKNRNLLSHKLKLDNPSQNRSYFSLYIFESVELFNSINDLEFIESILNTSKLYKIGFIF